MQRILIFFVLILLKFKNVRQLHLRMSVCKSIRWRCDSLLRRVKSSNNGQSLIDYWTVTEMQESCDQLLPFYTSFACLHPSTEGYLCSSSKWVWSMSTDAQRQKVPIAVFSNVLTKWPARDHISELLNFLSHEARPVPWNLTTWCMNKWQVSGEINFYQFKQDYVVCCIL